MKFFFVTFILFTSFIVKSQNTFDITISSNDEERLTDLIETEIGNFIISGEIRTGDDRNGYIVKLNSGGEIIDEKLINLQDSNFVIQKITIEDNNFNVYGFAGSRTDNFNNKFVIQKYDSNFNFISEKRYNTEVSNSSIERIRFYKKNNSNIVLFGFVEINNEFDLEYFFFEITATGDSIQYNQYSTEHLYNVPYSLLEKKDNSGYYCYASRVTGEQNNAAVILKLDAEFNIIGYNGLSQEVNLIHNTGELKWVTDTSYIVCGTTHEFKKDQDNDLGIAILDTANHEVIHFSHSGKQDTIELYGVYKSMEFSIENEYIYTGGFGNYSFPAGSYGVESTYYVFNKLDKNLNLIKEKFITNSYYNVLYFFKKTFDNGFIYLSSTYNYQLPEKRLDTHILKVDSLGNLPVSIENPQIKAHELILYPNPGNEQLNIKTAIQRIGGEFKMYDISGKLIHQQKITERLTEINTQNLPSSTYIYNYIHKGKEIESGKWIKQ